MTYNDKETWMPGLKSLLPGAIAVVVVVGLSGASAQERPQGYLAPDEFDVTQILEPPPKTGDPRYRTDREIFRATRKLKGSARWALATRDAVYGTPALMQDFSCAVGVSLSPENAPKTAALMRKAGLDTAIRTSRAKNSLQRLRPFLIDKGDVCEAREDLFDKQNNRVSYDYPSGHVTYGWTWALVLASAVPDRVEAILRRGRAYADSRFVCGSHNESAVEAGMLSATATMTAVAAKPAYQEDLAGVRSELAALRSTGPAPVACEAEEALVAQRVMPRLTDRR